MTRYLLDTDGTIDFLAGIQSTVALFQQLEERGDLLCTCDVVVAEVYAGLLPHHRDRGERLLDALEYLPTSRQAARQAGEWRDRYKRQGRQLPTTDCIIAAVAHDSGAELITANLRHFPMPEITVFPLPRAEPPNTQR